MSEATDACEMLRATMVGEGRDSIRQDIAALQRGFDDLYNKVTSAQRNLEINLVEWTSYTDSIRQVEVWLNKMESLVLTELPQVGLIDEKKALLQNYMVFYLCTSYVFDYKVLFSFFNHFDIFH